MKDLIIEQIRKAKDEAVSWANHEIKAIVVKYQGRKDKKQLLEAELLKTKEFQDSAVGNGYINSLAPGFATDEELIQTIANYYLTCDFLSPNPTIGWTDESTLKYVHDDSLIFLRRYYLVKYLSRILTPPIPQTVLQYFKNEVEARKFLNRLNRTSKAKDVLIAFREFSRYNKPTDLGNGYEPFANALYPDYYCQSYKSLYNAFEPSEERKKRK